MLFRGVISITRAGVSGGCDWGRREQLHLCFFIGGGDLELDLLPDIGPPPAPNAFSAKM